MSAGASELLKRGKASFMQEQAGVEGGRSEYFKVFKRGFLTMVFGTGKKTFLVRLQCRNMVLYWCSSTALIKDYRVKLSSYGLLGKYTSFKWTLF